MRNVLFAFCTEMSESETDEQGDQSHKDLEPDSESDNPLVSTSFYKRKKRQHGKLCRLYLYLS